MIRAGTSTSTNWGGYAVTAAAGSVTDAKGSWMVPSVTCSPTNAYAAFWVGIDGDSSSTVEQTGVMAQCSGGAPSYSAWYEFYPKPSFTIGGFVVNPGDIISAEVSYAGGKFTVTITDGAQSFSKSATVNSAQRSSAEWIAEAPSSGGSILPLADFGIAYSGSVYTGVGSTNYATISGVTGTIASFGSSVQSISMVTSLGAVEDQPSGLSSDGTSFTMTYLGSSGTTTTTSSTTSTTSSTTGGSQSLSVAVNTDKAGYTQGSWAYITVIVTSSGTPISGASMTLSVTNPSGGVSQGSGTTNSNGAVTFKYRISPNAALGTYLADASASAIGYSSGSGSTTFTVT